jgi:hypothetical protein
MLLEHKNATKDSSNTLSGKQRRLYLYQLEMKIEIIYAWTMFSCTNKHIVY